MGTLEGLELSSERTFEVEVTTDMPDEEIKEILENNPPGLYVTLFTSKLN